MEKEVSGFSVSGSEDQPTRSVPVVDPADADPLATGLGVDSPAFVHASRIAGRPPTMTTAPSDRRKKSRLE